MPSTIPLTRGLVAIVDDDLHHALARHRWCAGGGYAHRGIWDSAAKKVRHVLMHHEVLRLRGIEIPPGMEPDHINRNRTDNRTENLRLLTRHESMRNRSLFSTNKSGYRGVYWCKESRKWRAQIAVNGKKTDLGLHATPEVAAAAYEQARERLGLLAASG